ncbi:hypothetical protein ACHWQZ_G007037 [Mnemiopsis leidyi]
MITCRPGREPGPEEYKTPHQLDQVSQSLNFSRTDSTRALTMEVLLKTVLYTPSLPVTTSTHELLPVEVHNLLKLSHPNIQTLLDFSYCQKKKAWTLTLDYSSSWRPLSDVIRTTLFDEEEVREIARKLLSAITHCINNGVDHRDISTDNIYIDLETQDIKLGNFHQSTVLSVLPHSLKLPSCSPTSIPPELYRKGSYTPFSAAVWSVGCVLFELLSGSRPLLSAADAARNNVRWEMLPPNSVSPDVYSLILQCLNPDTRHRFSFNDLVTHPWIVNETLV